MPEVYFHRVRMVMGPILDLNGTIPLKNSLFSLLVWKDSTWELIANSKDKEYGAI